MERVIRFLVLQKMCGNTHRLEALYLYIVKGMKARKIARRLFMSSGVVYEAARRFIEMCGSRERAKMVLESTFNIVKSVDTFAYPVDSRHVRCMLCGEVFSREGIWRHFLANHYEVVKKEVEKVCQALKGYV